MLKSYCFDLDNTLCNTKGNDYDTCTPIKERVDVVNFLYDKGHNINIYTARGMTTYNKSVTLVYDNLYSKTKQQLVSWGIKHHVLTLGKPSYDEFICDKAYNSEVWFNNFAGKTKSGFIAGSFDVIHPGYIEMFKECSKHCEFLTVGLHVDPSLENGKISPVLSVADRKSILTSLKYVHDVVVYDTEEQLLTILAHGNYNVRFLGDDYILKNFTGKDLKIPIVYLNRDHGWSTTKFKQLIYGQFKN